MAVPHWAHTESKIERVSNITAVLWKGIAARGVAQEHKASW